MQQYKAHNVIAGTHGKLWVNGEEWVNVIKFEANVTGEYDDVVQVGKLTTGRKMLGWSGAGTITCNKVDSKITKLLADDFKQGITPDVTLVASLSDPQAFGAERIVINDIVFDEFMLIAFETKAKMEEEVPFTFEDYEYIDLI